MYQKLEKYTVNIIPNRGYEVEGIWQDDLHDIRSRIVFDYYTYQVVEAEAATSSLPFDICRQGIEKVKNIIGLQAGPGFHRAVKERLSGSQGCIHLAELVANSMKAVLQAASRQVPDWVGEDDYGARWQAWESLYKDTCIYFSQPDALKNLQYRVQEKGKRVGANY